MKNLISLLIALSTLSTVMAQEGTFQRLTYNEAYLLGQNQSKLYTDSNSVFFHTSIRPYGIQNLLKVINPEEVVNSYSNLPNGNRFQRKLFYEDLIQYRSEEEEFDIRINPLLNFSVIADKNIGLFTPNSNFGSAIPDPTKSTGYTNTRGIQILGQLGKRFSFYTEVYENQIDLPGYVKDWSVQNELVSPGEGIVDFLTDNQYDYLMATGYIRYRSKKYFTFEFGNGKNFIGDGYRSLLLSDNAVNYPYLKVETTFGKVKYLNLFTKYLDVNPSNKDENHYSKWSATHYLTFNIGKKLSLGLFESTMWGDRENQKGYDITYLNPIIFYRSLEFMNGSEGVNVLLGGNAQFKVSPKTAVYSQFVLDEFKIKEVLAGDGYWGNKYGFQLGIKSFDIFKVRNLNLLSEINYVRPFTYSHEVSNTQGEGGLSNYGHLNQALAHPLGANFIEWMSSVNYQYRRWILNGELMVATKSFNNPGENYGGDIYLNYNSRPRDYGFDMLIGNKVDIINLNGSLGYIINPSYNLKIEAGLTIRNFTPEIESPTLQKRNDVIFTFGLKTDLFSKSTTF